MVRIPGDKHAVTMSLGLARELGEGPSLMLVPQSRGSEAHRRLWWRTSIGLFRFGRCPIGVLRPQLQGGGLDLPGPGVAIRGAQPPGVLGPTRLLLTDRRGGEARPRRRFSPGVIRHEGITPGELKMRKHYDFDEH